MSPVNNSTGKTYWRSEGELAETPEFQRYVDREFPYLDEATSTGTVNRRQFLKLMSASMALGGLTACRRPVEKIVPYVKAPEEVIPGVPLDFATTMPLGEQAFGLVVESHEGRPTKIEGNDLHPATMGASNALIQAETLVLYDPDRSPRARFDMEPSSWLDFTAAWAGLAEGVKQQQGQGMALLTQVSNSPTMARLVNDFKDVYPQAQVVTWEPVNNETIYAGVEAALGQKLRPLYHTDKARILVTLDSNLFLTEDNNIRNARGYADGRDTVEDGRPMNRLYSAESTYTITGGMADYRLPIKSSRIRDLAILIGQELGVAAANGLQTSRTGIDSTWLNNLIKDLKNHRGQSLLVAGREQPAGVHALVTAINMELGNVGETVTYVEPLDTMLSDTQALGRLAQDMKDGSVQALFVLGGNPVYDGPADFDLGAAIANVDFSAHLSLFFDETSRACKWHLPQTHFLESWSDARALDGTLSVVQPLISPLYKDCRTGQDLLHLLTTGEEPGSHELVRQTWQQGMGEAEFEAKWRRALHDGVYGEALQPVQVGSVRQRQVANLLRDSVTSDGYEVVFSPSVSLYDGRYGNNGWLQETPDPVTKITWDNAAVMSHNTAKKLGVDYKANRLGELEFPMVVVSLNDRELELPAYILPGQADDVITLELGYGRKPFAQGDKLRVAEGVGFNVYPLRTSSHLHIAPNAEVRKSAGIYELAITQDHHSMEGRALIREAHIEHYKEDPHHSLEPSAHLIESDPLWEDPIDFSKGYQWGMAIDLNKCIGCNACQVACQSENNIPVVGKEQVGKGREMSWIRIDRYFASDEGDETPFVNPQMRHQPVPCMHCETAPCEQVCPVAATVHDKEGLNAMVYNRCIGTRYCSNNCPFKVRRFNFFNYTNDMRDKPTVKMAMNPDVTVRFRGVMEKCTYCTQRINQAKIKSRVNDVPLKDGDIKTACQQACPVNAISFGDQNNPSTKVAALKMIPRNYGLLEEFNTRPRTTYLGRITNGELPARKASHGHGASHDEGASHGQEDAAPHGTESTTHDEGH